MGKQKLGIGLHGLMGKESKVPTKLIPGSTDAFEQKFIQNISRMSDAELSKARELITMEEQKRATMPQKTS